MSTIRRRLLAVLAATLLLGLTPLGAAAAGTFQVSVSGCVYQPDGSLFQQNLSGSVTGAPPGTVILVRFVTASSDESFAWGGITDANGSTPANFLVGALINQYPMTLTAFADVNGNGFIDPDDPQIGVPVVMPVSCPPRALDYVLATAISDGSLSGGETSSLLAKVDAAGASVDRDNIAAGIRQLEAFVAQVRALTDAGRISTATGSSLIQAAEQRIAELEALL